ncbi:N-acetylmuramoyl-L-alanine amidase [Sulfidibacter corallicola]|uniref:N-acetylmuramoyl-L-alanine amidase n=1 Tax=Sulfidibacter corallicola TaxID=2818388 RepID=A0A8A4TPJ8_SULCO|nr:N-acetylmuramoyl-L-alanine amidase [Sulfidibacter corallicola]QTD51357.1 N-acetylmuramoyl-L-alanine amidase [Sulfidibacter corallicola]
MPLKDMPVGYATSTWCAPEFPATARYICDSLFIEGQIGPLFVSCTWPSGSGRLTLKLAPVSDSTSGRVLFKGADGQPDTDTMALDGDFVGLIELNPTVRTDGDEPDVLLTAHIAQDEWEVFHLSVKAATDTFPSTVIRAADGTSDPPPILFFGAGPRLKAIATPGGEGTWRWVSATPHLVFTGRGDDSDTVTLMGSGQESGTAVICVYFQPEDEDQPGDMAVYRAPFLRADLKWTRDVARIADTEIQSGDLIEMTFTMDRPPFWLNDQSPFAFFVADHQHLLGTDDAQIVARHTAAFGAVSGFLENHQQEVHVHRLADGEAPLQAVAAFKRVYAGDFHQRFLILEASTPQPRLTVIGWWGTAVLGGAGETYTDFLFAVKDRFTARLPATRMLLVLSQAVTPSPVPENVFLELRGALHDAYPFRASTAEPVSGARLVAGGDAVSAADGTFTLTGRFKLGTQKLVIERLGIVRLELDLQIGEAQGQVELRLSEPGSGAVVVQQTRAKESDPERATGFDLDPIPVTVHKVRGILRWPDSRENTQTYPGTPLAGKRVYAVPLAEGATGAQRPADTKAWADLAARTDLLASVQPGTNTVDDEGETHTADDGAYELKYLDLSPGKRWFLWGAGPVEPEGPDVPEFAVRTEHHELRAISGANFNDSGKFSNVFDTWYQIVLHRYYLSDATAGIGWGGEVLVSSRPANADPATPPVILRPGAQPETRDAIDGETPSGIQLTLDAIQWQVGDCDLHLLPLAPIFGAPDRQSAYAREVRERFRAELDVRFFRDLAVLGTPTNGSESWPFFHGAREYVLDARKIERGIDLGSGTWEDTTATLRQVELLEKTRMFSPAITVPTEEITANGPAGAQPLWHFDTVTLADLASVHTTPAEEADRTKRALYGQFVPLLSAPVPHLLAVLGGRVLLMPGHGFLNDNSVARDVVTDWASTRGSPIYGALEDNSDADMSARVMAVLEASGMEAHNVREVRDLQRPGVTFRATDTFVVGTLFGFPRLYQQNPVYFLGADNSPVVIGTGLGNPASGGHEDKGIVARRNLAAHLENNQQELDMILAIHTNANNGTARGISRFWLQRRATPSSTAETNTLGMNFADLVQLRLHERIRLRSRASTSRKSDSDIRETQPNFHQTISGTFIAVDTNPGGGGWSRALITNPFPVALLEVGFHNNEQDGRMLSRRWFKRRAGEAMAIAMAETYRDFRTAVSKLKFQNLMRRVWGRTPAVEAVLAADAADAGDAVSEQEIRDFLEAVTGIATTRSGALLATATEAIEDARNGLTRNQFVTALRDTFARVAGYPSGHASIEANVLQTLAFDTPLANLARADFAITRGEAAAMVATGFGLSPANLDTMIARAFGSAEDLNVDQETLDFVGGLLTVSTAMPDVAQTRQRFGGQALMAELGGAAEPEKYLAARDARDLLLGVAIQPRQAIYQASAVRLVTETGEALPRAVGGAYALRPGTGVRVEVPTIGVPWFADAGSVRFTFATDGDTPTEVSSDQVTRNLLTSEVWNFEPEGIAAPVLTVEVQFTGTGDTPEIFRSQRFPLALVL